MSEEKQEVKKKVKRDEFGNVEEENTDVEVKKETKYKIVTESDAEEDLEDAADKVKAAAKAVGSKIMDIDKDLGAEYKKEKLKEKTD